MDANKAKRMALFLIGCMGTRLALVRLAYVASVAYPALLPLMGALAILPAIGFFVIYFGGLRKTGAEVFGDRIWWNDLRPVHGLLYTLFAIMALSRQPQAWIVLLVDVAIGFTAFVVHHIL
jgi:hypothetical protein